MSGFVGWINNKNKLTNKQNILKEMNETLNKRGSDSTGYYFLDNLLLGHKRLAINDIKNGLQPMQFGRYTIVYDGEIYNTEEIKNNLIEKGYTFKTTCDTEVLLKAYVHYKEKVVDIIEGIYAFVVYHKKELFMARDRLGVKPLFYTKKKNNFIFASEIKALLKNDLIQPIINKKSLRELFTLAPYKMPGSGIFKDIYELKPGHYLKYKKNKIKIYKYWDIKNEKFNDSFDECQNKVRNMLVNSIKKQITTNNSVAIMVNDNINTKIIKKICSNEINNKPKLITYSINSNNNLFNLKDLSKLLKDIVITQDLPGIIDIESSLYWYNKTIKKEYKVILSDECADEIFGGYNWFCNEKTLNYNYYILINSLLNKKISSKLKLNKYIIKQYKKVMKKVPKTKNKIEQKYKNLFYLNLKWYLPTLLYYKDRMTSQLSIENRFPFTDHKLIEYLWNVPWNNKFYQNIEKGLLKETFNDLLTDNDLNNDNNFDYLKYRKMINRLLKRRLKNKNSILYKLFDINKINDFIETNDCMYEILVIIYLYQFDIWVEEYNIVLDI